jgi:hypothetical protein
MANIANVKVKQGNILSLSGSSVEITGSTTTVGGDLNVLGTVTANEFHVTVTTSSILYTSGSTKFGDTVGPVGVGDTHEFSGSVLVTNSVSASEFTGSGAGLTNLTASQLTNFTQDVRAQLSGSGSIVYDPVSGTISSTALTNAVTRVISGSDQNITISNETGPTVTASLSTNIAVSGNITSLTGTVSGAVGKFTQLSASSAEFSGNVLIYGSASLSNTSAAYVRYESNSGSVVDKVIIFPGFYASGSSEITGNLNVTGTVSASLFSGSGAGLTNLPATNLSGIVSLANGGTGKDLSASISSGKLLIGSGSELVVGELTQGSGISITKNSGSIEIASTVTQGITQVSSSDPNLVIQSGSGPAVTASLTPNPTFGSLTVTSSLNVSASLQRTRRTVTGSVSVAATDQAIFVNPAAATVVTLPLPSALDGRELIVKRVDDPLTAFTVDVSGANIDDGTSFGLNGPMQSITLIADSGSNKWFVV